VLTVSFTSGLFSAGAAISFSFGTVTNPTAAQAALSNISTVAYYGDVIQGFSIAGTFPAIVDSISLSLSISLPPQAKFSSLKFSTGILEPYPRISSMASLFFSSPFHGCSGTANITTVSNELTLVLEMTSAPSSTFLSNSMIRIQVGLAPGISASALILCSSCRTIIIVDGREHYEYGIYLDPTAF
jgi:hypothetical protein